MADFLTSLLFSSFILFIIMDPFPSIGPFLNYTRMCNEKDKTKCARNAVFIAGGIGIFFLFTGSFVLDAMRITINDFKIAGGIVLALLGLETLFGAFFYSFKGKKKLDEIAVLIATPLLTGPGVITSLIILSKENGLLVTFFALMFALLLSWFVLVESVRLKKIIGESNIMIVSRMVGLLLVALGISYIRAGFL